MKYSIIIKLLNLLNPSSKEHLKNYLTALITKNKLERIRKYVEPTQLAEFNKVITESKVELIDTRLPFERYLEQDYNTAYKKSYKPEYFNIKIKPPADLHLHETQILYLLKMHNNLIIMGNTGCGKSTEIPGMFLDSFDEVICTQPRRMAAISIANYLKSKYSDLVGYKV